MIFVILLLHCLNTLYADALPTPPTPPTISSIIAGFVNISPSCGALGSCRELSSIIKSCFATIYACAWVARHPDVPSPSWRWWRTLAFAAMETIGILIVPDMLLITAALQYRFAGALVTGLNIVPEDAEREKETSPVGEGDDSGVVDQDVRDFAEQWREGKDQSASPEKRRDYTRQDGFFVGMGGLHFYRGNEPIRPLTIKDVTDLAKHDIFVIPLSRDIDDRSKSSWITKFVALVQTVSFATQCITRLALHLPTTELELTALAYTTVTVLAYLIWWDKPVNIGSPVRLVIEASTEDGATQAPVNKGFIGRIFKRYSEMWRAILFTTKRQSAADIRARLIFIAVTTALMSGFGAIHCIYSWAPFARYWHGQETPYNYSAMAITIWPVCMGICSTLGTLMTLWDGQYYPFARALVEWLLIFASSGVGQRSMATNLLKTYNVVLQAVFPESTPPLLFGQPLKAKVHEHALVLRAIHASPSPPP
ncbi:hypothetical protein FIBSPDRAFT_1054780 [Athelia psychrophila]|uniref:Uncharacterized protein n=1 Tax=Athelia psychrophila TaxID=1759441 RepID=A0A167UTF0_9AGAM|nr:hypothetical protein FIBSPDRAFT_1054780 [Fibularhizoctonia sp. CBS 109695]